MDVLNADSSVYCKLTFLLSKEAKNDTVDQFAFLVLITKMCIRVRKTLCFCIQLYQNRAKDTSIRSFTPEKPYCVDGPCTH